MTHQVKVDHGERALPEKARILLVCQVFDSIRRTTFLHGENIPDMQGSIGDVYSHCSSQVVRAPYSVNQAIIPTKRKPTFFGHSEYGRQGCQNRPSGLRAVAIITLKMIRSVPKVIDVRPLAIHSNSEVSLST